MLGCLIPIIELCIENAVHRFLDPASTTTQLLPTKSSLHIVFFKLTILLKQHAQTARFSYYCFSRQCRRPQVPSSSHTPIRRLSKATFALAYLTISRPCRPLDKAEERRLDQAESPVVHKRTTGPLLQTRPSGARYRTSWLRGSFVSSGRVFVV